MIRLPPRSALFPNTTLSRSARKVRAIYVNYACHCVTLSFNKISGDWAGFAQELLQQEYPGAVALVSVGCGDRKSVVKGKSVDLGGRRIIKKKKWKITLHG